MAHDSMCLVTEMTREDGTVVYMGTCSCEYAEEIRKDERARILAGVAPLAEYPMNHTAECAWCLDLTAPCNCTLSKVVAVINAAPQDGDR